MKHIISTMRDMQHQSQQAMQDKIHQMQVSQDRVRELEDVVRRSQSTIKHLEDTIKELNDQISFSQQTEELIEELTEKNLILGEKVIQLEQTIADYEEVKNLQSEVEEYNEELIKELRNDIAKREEEQQKVELELQSAKSLIKERDLLINRFRVKVIELTRENTTLRNNQKTEETEMTEYKARTNNLLVTYHNLQEKVKKMKSSAIDQDIQAAIMKSTDRFLEIIQKYLPDKILDEDVRAIQALSLVDLLQFKLEIVIQSIIEEKSNSSTTTTTETNEENKSTQAQQEYSARDAFLGHLSFFLYLSLYMVENFKNSHLTDVTKIIKLGRFLNELQEAEQNINSFIYGVKQSELNEENVLSLLKPFIDHLERISSGSSASTTSTTSSLTWGSFSWVVNAVTNLCQDGNDIIAIIQRTTEELLSEKERSEVNKNTLKEFFGILKQDNEEYLQIVQMYRKLYRLCVEHKNQLIPKEKISLLQHCIAYGVLSYDTLRKVRTNSQN
jgi:hypothetical protein